VAVRIHIPQPLLHFTGSQALVELECPGASLHELLQRLFSLHPGIHDRILTEQGTIREHVNIFVGPVNVRSGSGLKTPVADGVEVWIIPAISGGQEREECMSNAHFDPVH
jgi:molybdopterin synthase sulfur carrier subunit